MNVNELITDLIKNQIDFKCSSTSRETYCLELRLTNDLSLYIALNDPNDSSLDLYSHYRLADWIDCINADFNSLLVFLKEYSQEKNIEVEDLCEDWKQAFIKANLVENKTIVKRVFK